MYVRFGSLVQLENFTRGSVGRITLFVIIILFQSIHSPLKLYNECFGSPTVLQSGAMVSFFLGLWVGLALGAEKHRLDNETGSLSLRLASRLAGPWSPGVCSRLRLRGLA